MGLEKKKIRNILGIVLTLAVLGAVLYVKYSKQQQEYYEPLALATHFNGEAYVGSQTCIECHADIYNSHIQTAHFKTSTEASLENIKGSFEEGANTLKLEGATFTMLAEGNYFYEESRVFGRAEIEDRREMNIVVGSGVKGQSYLTWEGDSLYQLQSSYYVPNDSWVNSPNYPNRYVPNLRPISDNCIKCHTTFAENSDVSGNGNHYEKRRIILGIDCERCHRPSAKHVEYHRRNPEATTAKFMIPLAELSVGKRLDICASCHSGLRNQHVKGNPFSFLAGENLEEYSKNYYTEQSNSDLDVHGNQYGLLKSSKCFKETPTMDCNTCHNSHKTQRGNMTHFNQKCMACHNTGTILCSDEKGNLANMKSDCISCHMPLTSSQTMKIQSFTDSLAKSVKIRTHKIAVYPR